ncbi:MAG: hypothetical protein ABIH86_03885 [Planctomycetota bacterium]
MTDERFETELKDAIRSVALTDGLSERAFAPAAAELLAVSRLKPAIRGLALTEGFIAPDAAFDELAAAAIKPAFANAGRASGRLADQILSRIRASVSVTGVPYLDWGATAFALGFALVIAVVRRNELLNALNSEWTILIGVFGIFVAASALLFNAGRVVSADRLMNQSVFGNRASLTMARSEILVVQGVGMALIAIFCRMFFQLTTTAPFAFQ